MRGTPIIKLIVTAYISPQLHGTGSLIHNYDEDLLLRSLPAEILDQLLKLHSSATITPAGFGPRRVGAQQTPD